MDQDRSARHHDRGPHPIPASARTARMAERQIVRPVGDALGGEALFLIRVEPAGFLGTAEAKERQEEGGGDSHRAGLYSTTADDHDGRPNLSPNRSTITRSAGSSRPLTGRSISGGTPP